MSYLPLLPFAIIAAITLAGALAAAMLPNLIHAALSLVIAFIGVAAFFFLLGAEFVGLVQVIVYVGAIAVLIVFTILLTRPTPGSGRLNWGGVPVALAVMAGLLWALTQSRLPAGEPVAPAALSVLRIGQALMNQYVWPLEAVGIVLTAALIGAVVLVMEEKR